MKRLTMVSAALIVASSGVFAGDKIKSGLQPGARAGAFNVLDVTGPNKGRKLCYR